MVDNMTMAITALDPWDERVLVARVAGPAALLIAKLHKLGERQDTPARLVNKDAHDIYRLLVAIPTDHLASAIFLSRHHDLAAACTEQAIGYLHTLFARGPEAAGTLMAGRAEEGIGAPENVSASATALAQDLLLAVDNAGR